MATTSVKSGLDAVSEEIADITARVTNLYDKLMVEEANLAAIPTKYATLVAEINAYTPTGAFETLADDELAKMTSEFQALKAKVTAAIAELV